MTAAVRPRDPSRPFGGRSRTRATAAIRRAPWPLVVAGLVVAFAALLPLVYLVIRATGADADAVASLVRPRTIAAIGGTVVLAGLVGVGTLAIGVPVAWLTARTDLPGRRAWAVLTAVPLAIPSYLVAFAFLAFFGPRGTLRDLLAPLGVERLPSVTGLGAAAVVLVLVSYPYVTLATRAALLRLDPAVEESARLLGDDRRAILRRIVLPLIAPAAAAGTLLAVLYALSDFGAVGLLQVDSLSRHVYLQLGASFDRSAAALVALVLVAMTVAVTWGERRLRQRAGTVIGGVPRRPAATVRLGRWRWPAVGFLGVIVGLALVLPVATIGWWLIRGAIGGEPLRFVLETAVGTFAVGGLAAVGGVALAVIVAVLAARYPSRLSGAVETSVFSGYALPGIVVALSMVFLATRTLPILYQTFALLIAVYAVRHIPQAVGGIRAALATAGTRLEDAGRTLGDGPLRVFGRVTLPILRPSLIAGGALIFLTVVKELPLALVLAPIGFETLATQVWDAATSGFYARAAAPAALLLVLSMTTVAVLLRAEERAR